MKKLLCISLGLVFSLAATAQNEDAREDYQKAREHMARDEVQEAMEDLYDALEESPGFVDARLFLADIYKRSGRPDSALSQYEQAMRYNPPYYVNLFYGELLFEQGQYGQASQYLKAYAASPQANPKYLDKVNQMLQSCDFASQAMQDPQPYDPQNLGERVNTPELEYFPSISADGTTLVFTHRALNGPEEERDEDFWVTTRDSAGAPWTDARRIRGFLNTPRNEGAQAISSDGRVLFFAACERPEGFGSCDIFASFLQPDGTWGKAANLGPKINTAMWESQPSISSDGLTLYFVRGRHHSDKAMDIYYSRFTQNGWTKAQRVPGAINTEAQETSPFIHFDNQSLYFSSSGHPGMGDLDFFVSRRLPDGSWGEPQNLGYPINTAAQEFSLIVAPDGKTGYFSSDAIESGFGGLDLYEFELPQQARAQRIAYVRGTVIDKKTREPLAAQIEFSGLTDSTFSFNRASGSNGKFYAVLPANSDYALSIAKPGYLFYSRNFKVGEQDREEALVLNVELIPIEVGQSVKLENVFFDFDSYQLDRRSFAELEKVVEFLKANAGVKVSLEGHTDNQGSAAYNKELSKNRAEAVYKYLKEQGIAPERMQYKGFGAEQPLATNETETGRALNRRTEMRITDYSQ